ncbi:MAG: sulfite exporter TauE/SafE family protein [Cyclobacteriaceae bacterium]|nr:sulfite exporter TauE/SafE family protein [Cyclobacteriaceae bacterium]
MENVVGYLAAILIGVSLGLFGGGGSILTILVLVYLFHIEPTLATGYSLIIVGATALVGGLRSVWYKMVDFRSAVVFSVPSMIAIYLTRHYVLPHIPEVLGRLGTLNLTKDFATMMLFSVLMIIASLKMIQKKSIPINSIRPAGNRNVRIALQGFIVGILTGTVGAGGGFLILPALVLLVGIPMEKAVGTSLIIIAINSFIGSMGDIGTDSPLDYSLALVLSALSIGGVLAGFYVARFFKGDKLKTGFGWFALSMAVFIIGKELFF